MKRTLRVFLWIMLTGLALAVAVRASVVANQVEGGWQILGDHLTAGLSPILQSTLGAELQKDWRWEQAERTEQDPQATADDLLCAAQLLRLNWDFAPNAPQAIGRVMWGITKQGRQIDFHTRAERSEKLRELAARATDLAPMDKDVWRARVLLLCDDPSMDNPASDGWEENGSTLRAAIAIDPTNALYDYLLAARCYNESQSRINRLVGDDYEAVLIVDPVLLQDAQDHYKAGFAKPEYRVGSERFASMADYLRRAPHSVTEKSSVGSFPSPAASNVIFWVRTSFDEPDILDADNLAEIDGINLWFVYQNFEARWKSQCSTAEQPKLADSYRLMTANSLSPSEGRLLAAINAWQGAYRDELEEIGSWSAYPYAAVMASTIGWALGGLAILSWLAAWSLRRFFRLHGDAPRPGWCYLAWSLALAGTLAILGFLCAHSAQISLIIPWFSVLATIFISAALIAAFFWFGVRFVLRQGKLQPPKRSILFNWVRLGLALITSFLILIPLLPVADSKIRRGLATSWSEFPRLFRFNWHTHVPIEASDWNSYVLLQWGAHGGLAITMAAWVVLLMIMRRRKDEERPDGWIIRMLTRVVGALRGIARSSLPLAAIMFLISIAAVTQWIVHLQTQYDRQLTRLANPRWIDEEIEANLKSTSTPLSNQETEADEGSQPE